MSDQPLSEGERWQLGLGGVVQLAVTLAGVRVVRSRLRTRPAPQGTGAGTAPASRAPAQGRSGGAAAPIPEAYEIAKAGGRHAGLLKTFATRSSAEIARGIRNLERNVELHRDKIANPTRYAKDWATMTQQQRDGLLRYWQNEASNYAEQADVLRGLLMEKARPGGS